MTFLGMGLYRMLRRAGLSFAVSGIAGGALLILYSLMIGAGVSSLRALIMFLVRIGAEITGRDYDLPTSLALSAAILCGEQPLYLTDAGFLLSYGAILGIVLFEPILSDLFGCGRTADRKTERSVHQKGVLPRLCRKAVQIKSWLFKGLATSIAVNLLLLGPLLYFYFEIPPYSVLLNLIVIPAMPVAMTAGAAGSLLALVSDAAGGAVLAVCKVVLAGYDLTCGMSSGLPYSRFVTGRPDMWWLILYYLALAALYVLFVCLRGKQERALRQCGNSDAVGRDIRLKWQKICRIPGCALLIFAAGMAFSCRQGYQMGEEVQVAALDVGQGDCLYVRGPSAHFLIDGGSSDVSDAAAYRIEPYLLSQAVEELDYVFVTHGDEDHINGIAEMLNNQRLGVKIKNLVLPPERYHGDSLLNLAKTAQEQGTRVMVMKTGDAIVDAEKEAAGENALALTLACLGPDGSEGLEADNSASLVLEASYGAFHMLFTGDLEERGEKLLVESGRLRACQVLKAAHHGSKNSGSDEFFQAVQPRITLISAGRDNRYGHPHKETLDRLKEYGSRVYSTQEYGTVTVWTDGETVKAAGFIR